MTTVGLVPCPLGPNCLTGTTQGHDPSGNELAQCQARANGQGANTAKVDVRPSGYSPQTKKMQKLQYMVKRAWGSDGRGIPNLVGPPGIGKSEFAKSTAEQMGADFMIFDVSAKDPDCLSGIPYNPSERTPEEEARFAKGEHVFMAGRLYDKDVVDIFYRDDRSEKPMVVFFDEINGGKEALLSSLQKVMTSRELPETGKHMNPNVFMMAAMNDADHTSNGTELAPAMVSRLTPIDFKPNFDEWKNGEMTFWGKGFDAEGIGTTMSAMGDRPPTEDEYLEAATHIVNYLDEMGHPHMEGGSGSTTNLFSMKPDEDDYSRKVGQPRSWSKAISGIAAAIANPPPGEDTVDSHTLAEIVRSNCGAEAAENFSTYFEQHRDLPNINDALDAGTLGDGRKRWKAEGRSDIPMFALSVIASKEHNADVERMGRAIDLMSEIAEDYPDMAASRIPSAVEKWTASLKESDKVTGETRLKEFTTILASKLKNDDNLRDAFGRSASARAASKGDQSAIDAAMGQAQKAARKRQQGDAS